MSVEHEDEAAAANLRDRSYMQGHRPAWTKVRVRIPAYVYLPWFAVALGGVIVGMPYDAGWRTLSWQDGACLPYRFALFALGTWGVCSRWMRDHRITLCRPGPRTNPEIDRG